MHIFSPGKNSDTSSVIELGVISKRQRSDFLGRGLGFMVEDGVKKTVLIFDKQADSIFTLLSLTCPRVPPCPA